MNTHNAESLHLSGAELSQFPELLTNKAVVNNSLKQLDLSCNQLSSLPNDLTFLEALGQLDLSDNRLEDLTDVRFPANLQSLVLNGNFLSQFPITERMESLTNLSMAGNKISTLPEDLAELLPNLRSLSLGSNLLTQLPEGFLFPAELRVLYLGGNALTQLPASMGLLSKLKVLSVHDNQLQALPASFVNLVDLEVLNLHINQITTLPVELVGIRKLRQLSVRQNPLVSNFAEAVHKQVPSLKELSGRVIKKHKIQHDHQPLPRELKSFLDSSRHCLGCGGAYFGSECVSHVEFIDMCGSYHVPFIQYICSSRCKEDENNHSHSHSHNDNTNTNNNNNNNQHSPAAQYKKIAKLRKILLDKYSPAYSPSVEVLEKEIAVSSEQDDFD